jgi:hypothetical protein
VPEVTHVRRKAAIGPKFAAEGPFADFESPNEEPSEMITGQIRQ